QVRYLVPGWYGIGRAFDDLVRAEPGAAERLGRLHAEWPFLRAVVAGARREMARARLVIASRYAERLAPQERRLPERIATEFARAEAALLAIGGGRALLEGVIARSIQLRNPYADVLNLIQ